ncbi:dynactin subunit 4 [Bemisia tabaci]|uniref:dynactin subunit 4 n=1 Tax=Bemisia tabaci TaxID=7038 RepID=UPI0008F9D1F4|nr:PREDICTED: dynactin subunit 4 [Bemisia tabaci]
MALSLEKEVVLIECGCGCVKPIVKLFLCRFCMKIRCSYCLCHEIDCCFCAYCTMSLPPGEARVKKNRCSSCMDCPSCFQALSLRATSAGRGASFEDTSGKAQGDNAKATKYYYFSCSFCRWSTRDVDLPDRTIAIGGWPEKEHPNTSRITELIDYYKAVAARDLKDKNKKIAPKTNYLDMDYYSSYHSLGLTQSLARQKVGLPAFHYARDTGSVTVPPITPSEANECTEELPEDIFMNHTDLSKIATLPQRFAQPEFQPELCSDFYPIRKILILRKSGRCWVCEHNVLKPEIQPISVKHKLNTSCFYHMPEVRIVSVNPFYPGKASNVILKFINPFGYKTNISFDRLESKDEEENADVIVKKISKYDREETKFGRVKKVEVTAYSNIYNRTVVLQPKNSAADFDDTPDLIPAENDSSVDENCLWTKNNKTAIRIAVTPNSDLQPGDKVVLGFSVIYSFLQSNAAPDLPAELNLSFRIFLSLGNIVISEES